MSSPHPSPDSPDPVDPIDPIDPCEVARLWEDPAEAVGAAPADPLRELLDDLGRLLGDD